MLEQSGETSWRYATYYSVDDWERDARFLRGSKLATQRLFEQVSPLCFEYFPTGQLGLVRLQPLACRTLFFHVKDRIRKPDGASLPVASAKALEESDRVVHISVVRPGEPASLTRRRHDDNNCSRRRRSISSDFYARSGVCTPKFRRDWSTPDELYGIRCQYQLCNIPN